MTKKDFELIAGILRDYRSDDPTVVDAMAQTFATQLANRNERFNYSAFIAAVQK